MKGFVDNIDALTENNDDFRRVIYTGPNLQLVVMSLEPGEEIGEEAHPGHDQFFRVEDGTGEVWIDGNRTKLQEDFAIVVPAGARHNVINTGSKPLKLYTIYSPPIHEDALVEHTRADALATVESFAGKTTE